MSRNGGIIGAANIPTASVASGAWNMQQVARQLAGATAGLYWPGPQDANFASVKGLWHFNECISDGRHKGSGASAHHLSLFSQSASNNGNPGGLATTQRKFGQYSYYTGGLFGLGVAGGSADYTFGTGDFTMEGWFHLTTLGVLQIFFDTRTVGGAGVTPTVYMNASNQVVFHQNGADRITGTTGVASGSWHHIAASRVSGSTYLYLDGTQEGSTYTDANNYIGSTMTVGIGSAPSSPVLGYIDDCRITTGVGRYSGASLTVPTAPFPDY
jgi:hypothetical protein